MKEEEAGTWCLAVFGSLPLLSTLSSPPCAQWSPAHIVPLYSTHVESTEPAEHDGVDYSVVVVSDRDPASRPCVARHRPSSQLNPTLTNLFFVADIRHNPSSLSPLSTPHRNKGSTRLGSLSPGSIPSSPTSVHSTSSAIFERDIEPLPALTVLSSTSTLGIGGLSPPNPHRMPRGRQAEDSAVPSVLTTAANALAVSSVSPSPSAPGSPLHHALEMSPSQMHAQTAEPFLVIAPTSQIVPSSGSSARSGRASRETSPGRASFLERKPRRQSTAGSSAGAGSGSPPLSISNALSLSPSGAGPSHSPPSSLSPIQGSVPAVGLNLGEAALASAAPGTRLSFVSYNDLLTSAPVSAVPLSALTQPASSDPPPHLSSTFALEGKTPGGGPRSGTHTPSRSRPRSVLLNNRTSVLLGTGGAEGPGVEGGEWEREGLGRGLEERLEELLRRENHAPSQTLTPPPPVAAV